MPVFWRITRAHNAGSYDYGVPGNSLNLEYLLESWLLELRAQHRSRHNIRGYRAGVRAFLRFCADNQQPDQLTKANVVAFLAARTGEASSTRLLLTQLKLFSRWLGSLDEIAFDADPILVIRLPKADQPVVPVLSDDDVRRMMKAADGRALRDKRDRALIALFTETGLRSSEMLALQMSDVDVQRDAETHQRRARPRLGFHRPGDLAARSGRGAGGLARGARGASRRRAGQRGRRGLGRQLVR